ncbi:MAG: hypothetical protein SFX73_37855 [Kofleriaceae bacterium]|nr:hypothetical protein [Kofleriaceae bacterium]
MMRTVTALSFATLSLVGCASQPTEENELPEVLVEGAADSFSRPTEMGTLFERVWQYGTIDPAGNQRNIAYTFTVDGAAAIEITTREAPVEEHERDLSNTVVYLYQQTEAGSFRRIAKTEANDDFGVLARNVEAGTYRVLVKGTQTRDEGDFMIRLGCEGEGCADGPQCLFGDTYYQLHETKRGAIEAYGRTELTIASQMNDATKAQIIAAVRQSSHEPNTIEEAFEAVDQNEINRDIYSDNLAGRSFKAFEYGAGDNSYGAIFEGTDPNPVAVIGDGDLYECKVFAQTCVFGRTKGEAAYMPDMTVTDEIELTKPSDVPANLQAQLIAALTYDNQVPTLAEIFDNVDDGTVYVTKYKHTDGREFVGFDYYSGDTPVGAFYAKGSTAQLGEISDGDILNCKAY